MFPIKIVCSCISLLVFQINPADTYNSEEYVSDSYTASLSFIHFEENSSITTKG
ncbi:hypothetical protein V6Z11_A09G120800 [Gossypium hirsutum]